MRLSRLPSLCLTFVAPFENHFSDSVVRGISISSPVIAWLFRGLGNPRDGLHVLQAEFHGDQKAKRRSMFHRERLTAEVCSEQRLRMACRRQIDRDKVGIKISRSVEIDGRLHSSPFCL